MAEHAHGSHLNENEVPIPHLNITPRLPRRTPLSDENGIRDREIILTFDDGPDKEKTPQVLDILAKHNIRAIFFVLGSRLESEEGQRIIKRAAEEGHIIANHSYSHANLAQMSWAGVQWELQTTQELIGDYGNGYKLFRPPYGAVSNTLLDVLEQDDYTTVMWTVDTLDWRKRDESWIKHGLSLILENEYNLVLMHDIHQTTVEHLDEFIQRIKWIHNAKFVPFIQGKVDKQLDNSTLDVMLPTG